MVGGPRDPGPCDASEASARLALIQRESARMRRHTTPAIGWLHLLWGGTWCLGYGILFLGARGGEGPTSLGVLVFLGVCTAGAAMSTAVIVGAGRHLRGLGRRQALGIVAFWLAGCILATALTWRSVRAAQTPGLPGSVASFLSANIPNSVFCLCISLTYASIALVLGYRSFAVVSAAVVVVATVALFLPAPAMCLVMAIGGGGVQLVVGALCRRQDARSPDWRPRG